MANEKVSELPPLLNLQDNDLIEITKYMGVGLGDDGGDYKSYKMTWAAFKAFIKYDDIVKIDFAGAGSYIYSADRYERVKGYVRVFGALSNETIQIENNFSGEEYVPTTDASSGDFSFYSQSSVADVRKLKITLSAAGTVYLFITKSLIP